MKVVLGRFGGRAEKISLKLGEIQVSFHFLVFIFKFYHFQSGSVWHHTRDEESPKIEQVKYFLTRDPVFVTRSSFCN